MPDLCHQVLYVLCTRGSLVCLSMNIISFEQSWYGGYFILNDAISFYRRDFPRLPRHRLAAKKLGILPWAKQYHTIPAPTGIQSLNKASDGVVRLYFCRCTPIPAKCLGLYSVTDCETDQRPKYIPLDPCALWCCPLKLFITYKKLCFATGCILNKVSFQYLISCNSFSSGAHNVLDRILY